MCVKNTLTGHLDRLDYTIYGAKSFLDEPWVDTERWLELKRIYNEILIECEPMMKTKK